MQGFSIVEMWESMGLLVKANALFMVGMSLWSIGVIFERLMTFRKGAKESYEFVLALRSFMQSKNIQGALTESQRYQKSPIAKVVGAGLHEYATGMQALQSRGPNDVGDFDLVDAVNRALERVKDRETANLRRGLGSLATIASAAPFVGLFGTVIGIINSFEKLKQGGGMDVIGPGIAEALVSTAFGLLVAIPAAMLFNFFTGKVEFFVVDMNDVSSEFVDFVLKEGRASK